MPQLSITPAAFCADPDRPVGKICECVRPSYESECVDCHGDIRRKGRCQRKRPGDIASRRTDRRTKFGKLWARVRVSGVGLGRYGAEGHQETETEG
jgi:hypothetical protein